MIVDRNGCSLEQKIKHQVNNKTKQAGHKEHRITSKNRWTNKHLCRECESAACSKSVMLFHVTGCVTVTWRNK
jgi:hypothetical protein